nr:ribonuclease H-like domain-containing protein [Tanacetum cinerariifolium]
MTIKILLNSCVLHTSVRSSLQLADDEGVTDLPISEIYSGMDALGYVIEGKLTFFKNKFSPQWRFLVHTLLHYLSPKSDSWDQFGSPIAIALICLSDGRVTKQYKVLVFSSKLFANIRLNFADNPMLLLPAMLQQAQAGEGAEVATQDVPHHVQAPDQSPPHLTTLSRPQSPDPVAPVLEHDHSSTQPETAAGSFPSMEDAPLGGNFYTSPLRSSHTPPTVKKVHSLKAELHDHKKLFKNVVGKLVKKVKSLEVKLKTKKRKMVVSDSDGEDDTTPNVDLDALRALANAAVVVDSDVPPGGTSQIPTASPDAPTDVPAATSTTLGASGVAPGASSIAFGASSVAPGAFSVAPGASSVAPGAVPVTTSAVPTDDPTVPTVVSTDSPNVLAGASNKGKSPMIKEDIPVPARTFRQMEEDRLGKEAAKRLHEEEMAELKRERAEAQRKRQQDVLESAKFYNEDDWLNIRAQVEAKASLSKTLLVTSPPSSRTRRKSLGRKHMCKPKSTLPTLDLDALAQAFLKVFVDEDSNDEDSVDEVWSAMVGWEILSTPLGDINALYRIDGERVILFGKIKIYGRFEVGDCTLSNIHVLETVSGEVLSMFTDVSYPLSVELMKKMLLHKLEIDSDFVGNDLTTAEQYVVPTGRVIVHADRYIVPTGSAIVATGRVFNSPMLHLLKVEMVINSPWIMPILGIQELASPKANEFCPEQTAISKDISNPFMAVMICQKSLGYFNSPLIYVLRIGLVINPPGYIVPTGRVIVPAGRYIVLTGSVIVATGRYIVPAGYSPPLTGRKIYQEWDPTVLFSILLDKLDGPESRIVDYFDIVAGTTLVQKLVTYGHVREFVAISIEKE